MAVEVKICGIMTPEHGRAAVAAGADYIGLVFAPSRRQITLPQAHAIVDAVRDAALSGRQVQIVGVFVNEQPGVISQLAAELGLDWAQLSGHETLASARAIVLPLVKAIRFDGHASEADWLAQPERGGPIHPLLVDAHVAGSFGGAGVTGDWQQAAGLAQRQPIWLAGGLTPENVALAVRQVQPQVVDVSSGVETDGVKDIAKVETFIRAARQAGATAPAHAA